MGDTETIDLETSALLDADSIPNSNQSLNCFSCGESMNGVYCHACGNKNDNYRRSIWSLGAELFASLTAFEGRIWRSLKSLIFKPGQMAREFSDGARQKWTSPIRLYLATSLLLFGYIALSQTQLIAFGTKMDSNSVINVGKGDKNYSPDIFFLERKSTIQKIVTEDAIKAFENDMVEIINEGGGDTPSENLAPDTENYETKRGSEDKANNEHIMNKSAKEANESDIRLTYASGESFRVDSEGIRLAVSIGLRQPERINAPINQWLPKIMFAMMPFSMLLGAIFIRGRVKAMLYDHLVHSAYIHAFSFLLLFVFILLVQLTNIPYLIWVYTAILLVYLPLSAKRMFGRGWFKSILTSYGVGVIYSFLMMLVLLLLVSLGLSDILKDVAKTPSP